MDGGIYDLVVIVIVMMSVMCNSDVGDSGVDCAT
jgi:hypothetical protein